jgi:hypothetical protein
MGNKSFWSAGNSGGGGFTALFPPISNSEEYLFTQTDGTANSNFFRFLQNGSGDNIDTSLRFGTVEPKGNISGIGGNLYVRQGAEDSSFSINTGSSVSTANWVSLEKGEVFDFLSGNRRVPVVSTTPAFYGPGNAASNAKVSRVQVILASAGTLRDLHIEQRSDALDQGRKLTYTIFIDGAATNLKLIFDDDDNQVLKKNLTNRVSVNAGSKLALEISVSSSFGGDNNVFFDGSVRFQ